MIVAKLCPAAQKCNSRRRLVTVAGEDSILRVLCNYGANRRLLKTFGAGRRDRTFDTEINSLPFYR